MRTRIGVQRLYCLLSFLCICSPRQNTQGNVRHCAVLVYTVFGQVEQRCTGSMLFHVICRRAYCLLSLRYSRSVDPVQRRSFQPYFDRTCVDLQRQQRGKAVATAYIRPMELLGGNKIESTIFTQTSSASCAQAMNTSCSLEVLLTLPQRCLN